MILPLLNNTPPVPWPHYDSRIGCPKWGLIMRLLFSPSNSYQRKITLWGPLHKWRADDTWPISTLSIFDYHLFHLRFPFILNTNLTEGIHFRFRQAMASLISMIHSVNLFHFNKILRLPEWVIGCLLSKRPQDVDDAIGERKHFWGWEGIQKVISGCQRNIGIILILRCA